MEAYVHGVSTRAVDELMAGLVLWFVAELHGDHRGLAERTAAGTQALWPFVVVITTRLVVRGATTLP
jgi:hypothetical protein